MTTLFSSETPLIKSEAFLSYIVKIKGLEMKFWAKKKKEKRKKRRYNEMRKYQSNGHVLKFEVWPYELNEKQFPPAHQWLKVGNRLNRCHCLGNGS